MSRSPVEVETAVAALRAAVLFAGYFVIYLLIYLASLAVTLFTLTR